VPVPTPSVSVRSGVTSATDNAPSGTVAVKSKYALAGVLSSKPSGCCGPVVPVKLSTKSTNGPWMTRLLLFVSSASTFHTFCARFRRIER